jgi:hypothetical protein
MKRFFPRAGILTVVLLSLCSCIGVNSDVLLKPDGSGTLILEYRISRVLESLGKQDGNARWLTIPVGKADFERTLERLPGLKMLSFSSREEGQDLVVTVKMEFKNLEALLRFFDITGKRVVSTMEGGINRLVLTLAEVQKGEPNRELGELFRRIAGPYRVRFNFTLPSEGALEVLDGSGNPLPVPEDSSLTPRGKQVSCSIPVKAIMDAREGINLELRWKEGD